MRSPIAPAIETIRPARHLDEVAPLVRSASPASEPSSPAIRGASAIQTLVIAGFCVLFLYHNYLPLFHSDLWGHVSYGEWMLEHRQLPQEDPFTPLAEGVPVVATAWLSQIWLAQIVRSGDVEWIAHAFAITVLLTHVMLFRSFRLRGTSQSVAALMVTTVFLIAWSRHAVQRPEVFGACCFAGLLWLLSDGEKAVLRNGKACALLPLFAVWANLHGSFVMGLVVLGCGLLGETIDTILQHGWRGLFAAVNRVHPWLLRCELAVLGTLLNPYGMDLLVYSLAFPGHPNLRSVLEWFPLEMKSLEGIPMAASWVFTAVVLRLSRRRMTATEIVLLLAMNAAVCARVRMIAWYAPVFGWALAPHVEEIIQRWRQRFTTREHSWISHLTVPSPRWAAVAVLLVWMTFAVSPISRPILGGHRRPAQQVFSHDTPLGLTRYLQEHRPTGLVAAPQWWGDWLARHSDGRWHVMATTNAIHLLPQQVWTDYLAISTAEGGLERRLDRYRINTLIVGKALQPELERAVSRLPTWKTVYEDDIGLVAIRTKPKGVAPRTEVAAGAVRGNHP